MRSCHDAVPFCQPKASRWRCAKYDPNALIIFSPRSRNHGHECANIYYHSWPEDTPNFAGFTRQDGDFPWRFVSFPEGSYRHLLRAAVPCWYLARVPPHIAIRQKPNNLCMYRCKFFKNGAAEKKKRHNISKYVVMHSNWNSFLELGVHTSQPDNVKTFAIALAATCQFKWTPYIWLVYATSGRQGQHGQNGQHTAVHHQFGGFVIKTGAELASEGVE